MVQDSLCSSFSSTLTANATGDFGTVIVSAQVRFPENSSDTDAARSVVMALANTTTFTPNT